jgi:perosamine synthetase
MAKRIIPLSKVYTDDQIKNAVIEAIDSGWYILGEKVREFEVAYANYTGVKNAIAVSSGTAALFLNLMGYEIGPGDEVIIPSFSFIATATPILHAGAKPIFVDVDPNSFNVNLETIKDKINDNTKAIIPVHLYGHPVDMDPLIDIAVDRDIHVIEDACQSHGASYKGKRTGSLGDSACFSFYPSKNMTVGGDGGMITTDDDQLADKLRSQRDHGRTEKYIHNTLGYNLRFNEIQAAIGIEQLKLLDGWVSKRRKVATEYTKQLQDVIQTPSEEKWAKHAYYMYAIKTQTRDGLKTELKNSGVATGIHYPVPIHKQPVIETMMGLQNPLPITETLSDEVLSLPMFPGLSRDEIHYICEIIRNYSS